MHRIFLALLILLLAACSELTHTKNEITQNAQVYEDAFNAIELARNFNQKNNNIHQRSLHKSFFLKL